MRRRLQLSVILGLLAVAIALAVYDATRSTISVTAQDGTELTIHLDAKDVVSWSGSPGARGMEGTEKYGVSVKPPPEMMPEGNPNEANLAGTKAR